MKDKLEIGNRVSCMVEDVAPNYLLVTCKSTGKCYRGVLINETCSTVKRTIPENYFPQKTVWTEELTDTIYKSINLDNKSKSLRSKTRQRCIILDNYDLTYKSELPAQSPIDSLFGLVASISKSTNEGLFPTPLVKTVVTSNSLYTTSKSVKRKTKEHSPQIQNENGRKNTETCSCDTPMKLKDTVEKLKEENKPTVDIIEDVKNFRKRKKKKRLVPLKKRKIPFDGGNAKQQKDDIKERQNSTLLSSKKVLGKRHVPDSVKKTRMDPIMMALQNIRNRESIRRKMKLFKLQSCDSKHKSATPAKKYVESNLKKPDLHILNTSAQSNYYNKRLESIGKSTENEVNDLGENGKFYTDSKQVIVGDSVLKNHSCKEADFPAQNDVQPRKNRRKPLYVFKSLPNPLDADYKKEEKLQPKKVDKNVKWSIKGRKEVFELNYNTRFRGMKSVLPTEMTMRNKKGTTSTNEIHCDDTKKTTRSQLKKRKKHSAILDYQKKLNPLPRSRKSITVGDVIWGKVLGYGWWPGVVLTDEKTNEQKSTATSYKEHSVLVSWTSSNTKSVMSTKDLEHFFPNFEKRFDSKKTANYMRAVMEAQAAWAEKYGII